MFLDEKTLLEIWLNLSRNWAQGDTQQFSLFSVVVMCISLHLTIPVLQMQTLFQLSEGDYLRVYQL